MKQLLIATHGNYASGVLSAAEIILGHQDHVQVINAYTESKNLQVAVQDYLSNIQEDDDVIILTDLFGGSVNQAFMPYIKPHIYLIAGFNLAMLLEILMLEPDEPLDEMKLHHIVKQGTSQIIFVNDLLATAQATGSENIRGDVYDIEITN